MEVTEVTEYPHTYRAVVPVRKDGIGGELDVILGWHREALTAKDLDELRTAARRQAVRKGLTITGDLADIRVTVEPKDEPRAEQR
ncbi:hypothetical protein [Streptacidiphilus cavernicola]|uniref:Uncharacterized protein n=1 Tax=Streptacidiphilus cavernicola TaxID=3342716 RepID=A0ABV6VY47_9ACTN